jgi:hypothetical protein
VFAAQNAHFPGKRRFYVTDDKYWPVNQWWVKIAI